MSDTSSPLWNSHESIWTSEKNDLLLMSTDSVTSYVTALFSREEYVPGSVEDTEGRVKISNKKLYEGYAVYHDKSNFVSKKLNKESFGPAFRKELSRYTGRYESKLVGKKGKQERGWMYHPYEGIVGEESE